MALIKFGRGGYSVNAPFSALTAALAARETGQDIASIVIGQTSAPITGTLAAQEAGSDTFSGALAVGNVASLAAQESVSDTFSGVVSVPVSGVLAAQEAGSDTFSGAGTVAGAIAFTSGTYTRGTAGVAPTLDNTDITESGATGPFYLDILTVTNGTTPSQTDMDNGSGTGVLEKVTLGPEANIEDLDGSLDLSVSLTNARIYQQYRDSGSTQSALTSTPVADSINYDAVAPVFSSAEVGTVDDSSLVVSLNKAIYGSTSAADWVVVVGGSGVAESAATVDGTTIEITIPAVSSGQTVTVAYSGTGLVGIDGEQVATFTAQAVTNNVSASGFSDDFNRADEIAETSASYAAVSGEEGGLSVVSNTLQLTDQTVNDTVPLTISDAAAQLADSTWTFDLTFNQGTGGFSNFHDFFPRYQDSDNWVRVRIVNNGEITIDQRVAGSESGLSYSNSVADLNATGVANTLVIATSGANVSVTLNGQAAGSTAAAPLPSVTGKRMQMADWNANVSAIDNMSIV